MSAIFNNVATKMPPRNNFNLSHEMLTSGRMGKLIPIQAQLVVPGDKFQEHISFLMRFAPLAGAAMARMNVHFHSFYVPLRLCTPQTSRQSGWEDFLEKLGAQGTEIPELPRLRATKHTIMANANDYNSSVMRKDEMSIGSLWDYFKLPTIPSNSGSMYIQPKLWPSKGLDLMKFYGYQLTYDQWYRRDQIEKPLLLPINMKNVRPDLNENVTAAAYGFELDEKDIEASGVTAYPLETAFHNLFKLRTRNYERDYFTSGLPEPQFGDDVLLTDGMLTIDENASIIGDIQLSASPGGGIWWNSQYASTYLDNPIYSNALAAPYDQLAPKHLFPQGEVPELGVMPANTAIRVDPNHQGIDYFRGISGSGLYMDSAEMSGIHAPSLSINEFRFYMQLQGVREKINRGGTRFKEIMNSIYHIDTSDARLQRVQYLGGCKNPVQIGTVIQTSETTENSPLGTLAGKATSAGSSLLFKSKYMFEEHGFIYTIMSVTPRTSYYGGIPREFLLSDPIDYYIPDFDRLGENVIYNCELFAQLADDNASVSSVPDEQSPDGVFAYTPQYSYLKSSTSSVTGEFRDTLRYLHLSRSFDGVPALSRDFIQAESEDFDRIFDFENINGTSNEHFYAEIVISQKAKRPMSKYSTPLTLM